MTKTSKATLIFYMLVCLIEIINIQFFPEFRHNSKPLIMPALFIHAIYLNNKNLKKISVLLIAIFFAWLGDLFLLSDKGYAFMAGLSSFLIMHLIYIYLFNQQRAIGFHKHKKSAIGLFVFALVCIVFFWDKTNGMRIPVSVYCMVIATMSLFALMRWKTTHYWYIVYGSFLFMLSDLLIALSKFNAPFPHSDMLVMTTFMLGQYLIVKGYINDL